MVSKHLWKIQGNNQATEKENCIDCFDCKQIQKALLTVERQMINKLLLFLIQPNSFL